MLGPFRMWSFLQLQHKAARGCVLSWESLIYPAGVQMLPGNRMRIVTNWRKGNLEKVFKKKKVSTVTRVKYWNRSFREDLQSLPQNLVEQSPEQAALAVKLAWL